MNICVDQNLSAEKICTRVPSGITKSTVFVVNLEAIKFKDRTLDDNGVYWAHSSPSDHFQGKISGLNRIGQSYSEAKRSLLNAHDHFIIRREYS